MTRLYLYNPLSGSPPHNAPGAVGGGGGCPVGFAPSPAGCIPIPGAAGGMRGPAPVVPQAPPARAPVAIPQQYAQAYRSPAAYQAPAYGAPLPGTASQQAGCPPCQCSPQYGGPAPAAPAYTVQQFPGFQGVLYR